MQGILLDLGLSSDQLADTERGFSFESDGPLDLRFDPERGEPAWRLLARLRAETLAQIIFDFGEERFSRRVARAIVEQRQHEPIRTARQLAQLVRSCVPLSKHHRIDPATRTFQALRIAVNHELTSLEHALTRLPDRLAVGGKLAIISFHSLEDRRVKLALRDDPRLHVLTRKPIRPTDGRSGCRIRAPAARGCVWPSACKGVRSMGREPGKGRPRCIVSGGQTGVDRGALDAAIAAGIPHGGWCPRGRLAEDGPIAAQYQLRETRSAKYYIRTRKNVLDSDATLILCRGPLDRRYGPHVPPRAASRQTMPGSRSAAGS